MESRLKLSKTSKSPLVDATECHSVGGGGWLRYLVNTRPDIAYVGGAAQGSPGSGEAYSPVCSWNTSSWCVLQHGEEGGASADSDHDSDIDDQRSTSSVLYCLG